jgi:3-deoxy-D-manno-octulosonate 8-phosphate phosphatase KdsC-like HAD superfamily phosphatase
MLRYGLFRHCGELPIFVLVTGQSNESGIYFAKREHFDYVFLSTTDKKSILPFLQEQGVETSGIAMVGDDINDLPLFMEADLRFLVNQPGSEFFHQFLTDKKICDYKTRNLGGRGAVREICELSLNLLEVFDAVTGSRFAFDQQYQKYWKKRNKIVTKFYIYRDGKIVPTKKT